MKITGIIIIIIALLLFLYGYGYNVSVEVPGTKKQMLNVGLMEERRIILIASAVFGLIGAACIFVDKMRTKNLDVLIKEDNDYFCANCGTLNELSEAEITSGNFICNECKKSNIIELKKS